VTIAPDLGEGYLDTIYHEGWVREWIDHHPLHGSESFSDLQTVFG
jgi:hypothetical protein